MGFTIFHRILLELNVWHHFFLNKGVKKNEEWESRFEEITDPAERLKRLSHYDVHRFLDIEPTPSCLNNLKAHRLILKRTNTGLMVGVKEGENGGKPYVSFDNRLKLTFLLHVKDPSFFNYSDLPVEGAGEERSVYYFHNYSEAETDFRLELSPDDWTLPAVTHPFVGNRQWLVLWPPLYNFKFEEPDKEAEIIITDLHTSEEAFRAQVDSKNNVFVHQLDWRHLPSGAYRMTVRNDIDEEKEFYLNNDRIHGNTLAIVEIFGRNGTDDYALLDNNGLFVDTRKFEVRIKNRRTIWRYHKKDMESFIVSVDPIPLTASGYIEVFKAGYLNKPLPNPNSRIIEYDEVNDQAISNTYLDKNFFE